MLNIVRASAGSGKTFLLTKEYIHLLFNSKNEKPHRKILAVTFTNKATEEMKSRIINELYLLSQTKASEFRADLMSQLSLSEDEIMLKAKKNLITILHDYSFFFVSTIDAFFQQIIRSFSRDLGINGSYNLELDNDSILSQSVDNLFFSLSEEQNKQLLAWLTEYAEERIEESESWNMTESILALGSQIFKENYQNSADETNKKLHDKIFLSTYKNKLRKIKIDFEKPIKDAAIRALEIINNQELTLDDFKGGSKSSIKKLLSLSYGIMEVNDKFFSFSEDVQNCYTKTAPKHTIKSIEDAYQKGLQKELRTIAQIFKKHIVHYNTAKIILKHINTLGILSDLAIQIKKLTREQNSMLISDSNLFLNKIIDNSETPFVYEKIGSHINHFMFDEFQDTSVLQWKNFFPLVSNSLAANYFNLVVGDVKQSIYRWRNSDWRLLDEKIIREFRPEQISTHILDTNYRSNKNIVDFNNGFFENASKLLQKNLNEQFPESTEHYFPELIPLKTKIELAYLNIKQNNIERANDGYVEFQFLDSLDSEKRWRDKSLELLTATLENIQIRGFNASDIAILVRTNDEAQIINEYLLQYKTSEVSKHGICYDVIGNESLLINSSSSIRFIVGMLHLIMQPDNAIQKFIVNLEYAKGKLALSEEEALSKISQQKENKESSNLLFSTDELDIYHHLKYLNLFELVNKIVETFELKKWDKNDVFIDAFIDIAFKYSTTTSVDLSGFLHWWKSVEKKQYISMPKDQEAIKLMTIHKSKGLDFEIVIIPFCNWDFDSKKSRILWCEAKEKPFDEIPILPINYYSKLNISIFSRNYFEELTQNYIDNLNIAYVSFTRPRQELYCFCPKPKKDKDLNELKNLPSLIENYFSEESKKENNNNFSVKIGTQIKISKVDYNIDYKTINTDKYIKRNIPKFANQSSILFDQENYIKNPINFGILMHDILKQIQKRGDETMIIKKFVQEGKISKDEVSVVKTEMEKFWRISGTNDWFSPNIISYNEITILTPSGENYRPDRIIVDKKNATIIDYKFGKKENTSHQSQLKIYMNLLSQMGYQSSGYLCYVNLGKITQII